MELFDLYDRSGNLLNKTMERGSTNNAGEYHLVVHIWIRNKEGKYLIQQRNKATDRNPFQWAATGGAVTSGEDSITGAIRETYEEIGILFKKEQLNMVKRFFIDQPDTNYITDLYLIEEDVLIKDCVIDKVEVKDLKYYTLDEYTNLVKNNNAWHYERTDARRGYYEALEKS